MIEFLLAPLALVLASGPTFERALAAAAELRLRASTAAERPAEPPHATYLVADRSVSNWRAEALDDLQPRPVSAMAALLNVERPFVTRCVKLNNYWCIKGARWNGEIGHRRRGPCRLRQRRQGADAAATLLRRYYLEFGRKSALDIVRRWAPAECRGRAGIALAVLAVRGHRATLRARWLAARAAGTRSPRRAGRCGGQEGGERPGGGAAAPACAIGRSAAPASEFRVPDIAVGIGETPGHDRLCRARARAPAPSADPGLGRRGDAAKDARAARLRTRAAEERSSVAPVRVASAAPAASCTPERARIRNYAARMVAGPRPRSGRRPQALSRRTARRMPNLPHVMLAMSAVELGVLEGQHGAVEAAIGRAGAAVSRRSAATRSRSRCEPELPAP